MQSASIVLMN